MELIYFVEDYFYIGVYSEIGS